VDAQAPRQDFAQRLSQWLGVSDAMTLYAAHQSIQALAPVKSSGAGEFKALQEKFDQVRSALLKAIGQSGAAPPVRHGRGRTVAPLAQAAPDAQAGFAAFAQRYLDQQRQMALRIEVLREQVRQVLSLASPRLAQLAALDEVLEQMFGGREQKLMGVVPMVLERRFEQLRTAHQLEMAARQQADDPALWRQPGGWIHSFDKELEATLLAELEVRLQPVTGLMEALELSKC
jgi:hypothetical protein